ncbi:serine endopeptidase [Thozetella sp. PMI_491]|nr:serine endopeptidase [Thozetella sp. PMI_491]
MQLPSILLTICLASGSLAQHRPLLRRGDGAALAGEGASASKYIVEFTEGVDPTAALDSLTSTSGAKVLKVFNSNVFRGAALETVEDNVDTLLSLQPVFQAWPSRQIRLAPVDHLAILDANTTVAGTPDIHFMTGVDKLHEQGILGKGAIVAVVDTGTAYRHPTLGGGFGPGFKVAGGYDLVGNKFYPDSGPKAPDSDPDDQQGHGTHVAGIIAGKGDQFIGVAPEATLLSYKVFSQAETIDEETLIEAFLMAYEGGADIITASIGGSFGWTNSPWALVASRLVDLGVVVTISAGNSGAQGAFVGSSGSSGANVLSIASINAEIIYSTMFEASVELIGNTSTSHVQYMSADIWANGPAMGLPVVPLTLDINIPNDACSELPSTTPDFTDKIALVRRGSCNFSVKQANLAKFGAKYILFYNGHSSPMTSPGATDPELSLTAMVSSETGENWIALYQSAATITIVKDVGAAVVGVPDEEFGGLASDFTSTGPTNDLFIKPDVAAPGGSIFSTYLQGSYAVLSGTSMACPYVAGVAALYIGKYGGRKVHGDGFAKTLAARIRTSGEDVPWDESIRTGGIPDAISSVAQVGTGLINATKVLTYDTQLSFVKFHLNDTHHFSRYHSVGVTNTGSSPVTYSFELQDVAGFNAVLTDPAAQLTPRMGLREEALAEPQKWVPKVSLPSSFTLAPGQSKTAKISFEPLEGLDGSRLPIYSGKVLVKGSNGETLAIPYLGLGADLHNDIGDVFQYSFGAPTLTSTTADTPISEKATFTFNLDAASQDFPHLWTFLKYGTTELRWDIFEEHWVERDWKYPPVVGKAGYVGSATAWAGDTTNNLIFDPTTMDPNFLFAFPQLSLPRDYASGVGYNFWFLGKLANGTDLAPGKYKFRVAALVPFGTPENSNNWDVFGTPLFEVLKN